MQVAKQMWVLMKNTKSTNNGLIVDKINVISIKHFYYYELLQLLISENVACTKIAFNPSLKFTATQF